MPDLIQLLMGFAVALVTVFLKVTQQQNVIHNRKTRAVVTSFMMCAADVALVGLVVQHGWLMAIPSGFGGALGVWLSLYLYPRNVKESTS